MSVDNQNEATDIVKPDLEIVRLNASENGRSYCQHDCCGDFVGKNDVLRLVKTVVTINNKVVERIKLCLIQEGCMTCTVGYVPRNYMKLAKVRKQVTRYCQVVELYSDSNNSYKRKMSHRNRGMASVAFLDEIPMLE